MKPIGTVKTPIMGGGEGKLPIYGETKIYGTRLGQTAIGIQQQVLIEFLDFFIWINVLPKDVTIFRPDMFSQILEE